MRCFVCAGTHSSKLFEFEFECCTVRLGDSPRKPFHNLLLRSIPAISFTFSRRLSSFLLHLRPLFSGTTFFSLHLHLHLHLHLLLLLLLLLRPPLLHSCPFFLSFPLAISTLCLCRARFLEPPSLNPNPKVRRSAAFLGFDSCYRAKLPPQ